MPDKKQAACVPLAVHVGFGGARRLFEPEPREPDVANAWRAVVEDFLAKQLERLPQQLRLEPRHFLCGISQVACGADTVFARVCERQGIRLRLVLPQQLEEFLSAAGSAGPDFTPTQRRETEALLQSAPIIQQRVVARSPDRQRRFKEVNAEIARLSDVVVCVVRKDEGAPAGAGGTLELLERAKATGIAALEITVETREGGPVCNATWHNLQTHAPPKLPGELESLTLALAPGFPDGAKLIGALKDWGSRTSKEHQNSFTGAAKWILGTHVAATALATVALALPHSPTVDLFIGGLLTLELAALGRGFRVHWKLHHSQAARVWAQARLIAELARSMRAVGHLHIYPEHLFRIPLPHSLRPLLRTISTAHLASTYANRNQPWQESRDAYLSKRIDDQKEEYYRAALSKAQKNLAICQRVFQWCSALAILFTLTKLVLLLAHAELPGVPQVLGSLAIVLPVLAVAGLSWAAALDYDARVETYRETLDFLSRKHGEFRRADTVEEFERLVIETESVLLGEVCNWFLRRANTGVT